VTSAVDGILAQWGQIDVLVNNAGWDKLEPFLESEEETWDRIIGINFKALLYVCKAVLPHMVARGAGKVINIASDAGRVGSMGEAVYAGTKGAIIAFSKTVAREMARHRITVNVVCPGLTETPLLQGIRQQSPKSERVIDAVTRAIPLGRVGQPEDVAGAVVYLASPAADYVTGQTLSVSGGLTMA
jgi:2-hydroxycyclohexanecarboxyl-CoA dehydrogenase